MLARARAIEQAEFVVGLSAAVVGMVVVGVFVVDGDRSVGVVVGAVVDGFVGGGAVVVVGVVA